MNRLILIGNGFDLAHGLKTDYNSFILWYLKKCFNFAWNDEQYEDELIKLEKTGQTLEMGHQLQNTGDFIDFYYKRGFQEVINSTPLHTLAQTFGMPFKLTIKSDFFKRLLLKCSNSYWVDIENQFYSELKHILQNNSILKIALLDALNNSLKFIINQLHSYLTSIPSNKGNDDYISIMRSTIEAGEIIQSNVRPNEHPDNILILNFNYTTTIERYVDEVKNRGYAISVNYIHGQINDQENPLIFGFGDELDTDYIKMEHTNINGFFEYMKSFWYFKTSNYHNLIRFLSSDEYQIFTLGHSCGLSDRTLLNMIFEHPNCKSIKIYYHGEKRENNYKRLTQEISRHFKDKVSLRKKIVPFDKCSSMPQI